MSLENLALVKLSRQIALHRELEVVANNIANLNTTGYKADGSVFQEFLMPIARSGDFQTRDQRLSYVHDRATWHNFSSGPIRQTGNPLDISLDGDAFLVVQTARGERYTRNGSLQLNANGQLVTASGDPVLGEGGPIQFQSTDSAISINADGTITVREAGNSTSDSARGKLRLVRFERMGTLLKDGASMFRAPDGTAPQPADLNVRVVQGTIEQSNVSAVLEMARMVEISRTYSILSNMIQQMGEHRRNAISRLADVMT